jgi:hypothetical protein
MKQLMRRHVCDYCPQILIFSSSSIDEVYRNDLTPLRICSKCYEDGKHSDKRKWEFVLRWENDDRYE